MAEYHNVISDSIVSMQNSFMMMTYHVFLSVLHSLYVFAVKVQVRRPVMSSFMDVLTANLINKLHCIVVVDT